MYRPANWEEIRHEVAIGTDTGGLCEGCEALVDAMLEALKAKSPYRQYSYGWLVFIPEGDTQ